jgi:hypothetical protein
MERGMSHYLSDENIQNFRPSFQPESFIALVNNGTDDLANHYIDASINYGTAIAPANTSPRFQRGHRVILHDLIAGETERNREAVRPAQNMYYEKFVKPYEDREGIVVQDWREYNEEFIAAGAAATAARRATLERIPNVQNPHRRHRHAPRADEQH